MIFYPGYWDYSWCLQWYIIFATASSSVFSFLLFLFPSDFYVCQIKLAWFRHTWLYPSAPLRTLPSLPSSCSTLSALAATTMCRCCKSSSPTCSTQVHNHSWTQQTKLSLNVYLSHFRAWTGHHRMGVPPSHWPTPTQGFCGTKERRGHLLYELCPPAAVYDPSHQGEHFEDGRGSTWHGQTQQRGGTERARETDQQASQKRGVG